MKLMRNKPSHLFLLVLIFTGLIATAGIVTTVAQINPSNGVIQTRSDIEMMVNVPFSGGGHVSWRVTGDVARELRHAIIGVYDDPAHSPSTAEGLGDGMLGRTEVERYKTDLDEQYLEVVAHKKYGGVNIRQYQLLNQNIVEDISGLIGTNRNSTAAIEIHMYFDSFFSTGNKLINLQDTHWHSALFDCIASRPSNAPVAYPYRDAYQGNVEVHHMETVISTSAFTDVNVEVGDFFLLRTPFGELYWYDATFDIESAPKDTVYYSEFSWIECPLVLFVLVILLGYFIGSMPNRVRIDTQPKVGWLHLTSKLLLLILLLMTFIGSFEGIFISGIYIWMMAPIFLFIIVVLSKSVYGKMPVRPRASRPLSPPMAPAAPAPRASSSYREERKVIVHREEGPPPVDTKPVQCTTCGEIYEIPTTDLSHSAICPACAKQGAADVDL